MTQARMQEISAEFCELDLDEMEMSDQLEFMAIMTRFCEEMEPFVKKYVESKKQVKVDDLDYLIKKLTDGLNGRDY